jgi:thioesterase domain-containing protein
VAHEVAARLAAAGSPPAALVLIDTSTRDSDWAKRSVMVRHMFDRDGAYSVIDDHRLSAMGAYMQIFSGWSPQPVGVPTLLVRADRPYTGWEAADEAGWQALWPVPHTAVDVPGDHFTVLEEHSATTAEAVQDWLARLTEQVPA